MNRRELLRIGAINAIGAALLLGTSSLVGKEARRLTETQPPKSPEPPATLPPLENLPNEEVIRKEAQRLGIKPSQKEILLWQKGYDYSSVEFPLNYTAINEAGRRLGTALQLMEQSENPYFRETADYLKILYYEKGILTINAINIPPKSHTDIPMAVNYTIEKGKFQINLNIYSNKVINDSNSVSLAVWLVHETEHIKSIIKHQESLPSSLTLKERLEKEKQRNTNQELLTEEEVNAYGLQAKAYIYHYGLGYLGAVSVDTAKYATALIQQCKSDIASACWKDYVEREILN